MRRTLALTLGAALAVGSLLPAQAATRPKPKPKPIVFSYDVALSPDPTAQVLGVARPGCAGALARASTGARSSSPQLAA